MIKSTSFSIKIAVLATAVVLAAAAPSEARFSRAFGRGFGRGGFGRGGFGFPLYYLGGPYSGLGYGYSPGGPGGYFGPSFYGPSMYDYNSASYFGQQSLIYMPAMNYMAPQKGEINPDNAINIDVKLPAKADLWFDGKKTTQTGEERHFATKPMMPGQTYSYKIRATWTDDAGKAVTRTRTVDVQAGQQVVVDLMKYED